MKIQPAKIRHMKTPYNSMQMWNMALTVITPPRRCLRRKPAYLFRVS